MNRNYRHWIEQRGAWNSIVFRISSICYYGHPTVCSGQLSVGNILPHQKFELNCKERQKFSLMQCQLKSNTEKLTTLFAAGSKCEMRLGVFFRKVNRMSEI